MQVLQQRFEALEAERSELKAGLHRSVYDVQQQAGLQNLILERKVRNKTRVYATSFLIFDFRVCSWMS